MSIIEKIEQIEQAVQELSDRGIEPGPLFDTVEKMISLNYKDRIIAEYQQTKIRYEKLKNLNNQIEAAEMTSSAGPNHTSPTFLLREQQRVMGEYLHLLEVRAAIEEVELEG